MCPWAFVVVWNKSKIRPDIAPSVPIAKKKMLFIMLIAQLLISGLFVEYIKFARIGEIPAVIASKNIKIETKDERRLNKIKIVIPKNTTALMIEIILRKITYAPVFLFIMLIITPETPITTIIQESTSEASLCGI